MNKKEELKEFALVMLMVFITTIIGMAIFFAGEIYAKMQQM